MTLQLEKRSTIFSKNKVASSNFNWHIPNTHTHTHQTIQGVTIFEGLNPPPKKSARSLFYGLEQFFGSHWRNPFFFLGGLGKKSLGPIAKKKHHLRLFFEELRDSGDRNAAAAQALRRLVDGEGEMVQWLGPRVCVGGWWLGGWMVAGYGYWRWLVPPGNKLGVYPVKIFEHMWLEGYVLLGVFRSILRGGRQFQRLRKGFYFKTFINPQFFKQWVGIIGSAKGHHSEFHFKKGS